MLHWEWAPPRGEANGTVLVMLHGRGSGEHDMLGLAARLPEGVGLVAPRAPFEAAPWGYGPGYAWYRYLGEDRPDPESFVTSQTQLGEFLDELPNLLPSRPTLLVLGGFSQGGTMSLGYALREPGGVAAVLNFSGFLPQHPTVRATSETVGRTRFFWGHGTRDPNIPFALAVRGRQALEAAAADLTTWESGIGHWIEPVELEAALSWLDETRRQAAAGTASGDAGSASGDKSARGEGPIG
jgi:phospholipase/carboxylesterase